MAFSKKLKNLMGKRNMKAADLARSTGLSEAAISDYLKGKKEPRGRQSIAIAKALDVSLDNLWETDFDSSERDQKQEVPGQYIEYAKELQKLGFTDDDFDKMIEVYKLMTKK